MRGHVAASFAVSVSLPPLHSSASMGSYGPVWMQCAYCSKWGKTTPEASTLSSDASELSSEASEFVSEASELHFVASELRS